MKLFALLITNNIAAYGGVQTFRQFVLFIFASVEIYAYDTMGRLNNRTVPSSYSYYAPIEENYIYKTYGDGYTTNLLTLIDDQTNADNDRTATYDENGYVTSVTYNRNSYTYTYDGAGRLASKTIVGTTKTYTYDSQNNVQKTGLTYANGKLTACERRADCLRRNGQPYRV